MSARTVNLDIDLLRTFAAVADSRSFTAAAELVARTQSAVSVQIRRLEELLGRRLIDRTTRSVALTRDGEAFLGRARALLELNDESVRLMAAPPLAGTIRLGVTEYFLPGEIAAMLARFARAFPGVQLEARLGLSGDLRDALAAGGLDAAIVRLGPRDRAKPIWTEPQLWVAGGGLQMPSRGTVPLALLPEPCVLRAHALAAMRRMRRAHAVAFTGSGMRSLQAGIAAGLGVSILPKSSVLAGMTMLDGLPSAGRLEIGIVKAPRASAEVLAALEASVRESVRVVAARA